MFKKFSFKKAALLFGGFFILLQAIRPDKNQAESNGVDKQALALDDNTYRILETSCFDCHSNTSSYKWYAEIMPIGWLIRHDIQEGKEHLNFAEWQTYTPEKRAHKLDEILEEVLEKEMPMKIYLLTHGNAEVSEEEYGQLVKWVDGLK